MRECELKSNEYARQIEKHSDKIARLMQRFNEKDGNGVLKLRICAMKQGYVYTKKRPCVEGYRSTTEPKQGKGKTPFLRTK